MVAGEFAGGFSDGRVLGFLPDPEAQRNMPAVNARIRACTRHFQLLDRILADRPFLCGDSLTLADIPAGTSLYRYFGIHIERPSVPNVKAWYRRLQERPAYREHIMVPFGELYGRLDY
jgi:glutathione S-transferase